MIDPELDKLMKKKLEEMKRKQKEKEEKRMKDTKKIIVYSTTTCPFCHMAKEYLKRKGIQFDDIDVGADRVKAQEMIEKSGQMGVPVIDINGKIIVGFNKGAIDAALSG